jgi:hypothetical protein
MIADTLLSCNQSIVETKNLLLRKTRRREMIEPCYRLSLFNFRREFGQLVYSDAVA